MNIDNVLMGHGLGGGYSAGQTIHYSKLQMNFDSYIPKLRDFDVLSDGNFTYCLALAAKNGFLHVVLNGATQGLVVRKYSIADPFNPTKVWETVLTSNSSLSAYLFVNDNGDIAVASISTVFKLDLNGSVKWSKSLTSSYSHQSCNLSNAGDVYLVSCYTNPSTGNTTYYPMQFASADGTQTNFAGYSSAAIFDCIFDDVTNCVYYIDNSFRVLKSFPGSTVPWTTTAITTFPSTDGNLRLLNRSKSGGFYVATDKGIVKKCNSDASVVWTSNLSSYYPSGAGTFRMDVDDDGVFLTTVSGSSNPATGVVIKCADGTKQSVFKGVPTTSSLASSVTASTGSKSVIYLSFSGSNLKPQMFSEWIKVLS